MKLLLVEDDLKLGAVVQQLLILEGHQTDWAHDGAEALRYVADNKADVYDVVLLDWMLPEMNGIELCKHLRGDKYAYQGGIIFLSARDSVEDKIIGLESGADDYMVKPFQIKELQARIKAVSRRQSKPFIDSKYSRRSIMVDKNLHQIEFNGKKIDLSRKEFELFDLLFANQKNIIPRATIFERIWREKLDTAPASLDSHIYMLRKKLKIFDGKINIRMVKNIGYVMEIAEND